MRAALRGLPVAMSYNLTVLDGAGRTLTAYLGPDEPAEFTTLPLATNHRGDVPEFAETARALHSVERRAALLGLTAWAPGPADLVARVPVPAAVQLRLLPGLRHPLHRALPAGGRVRRLLLAGPDLAPRTSTTPTPPPEITFHEAERARIR